MRMNKKTLFELYPTMACYSIARSQPFFVYPTSFDRLNYDTMYKWQKSSWKYRSRANILPLSTESNLFPKMIYLFNVETWNSQSLLLRKGGFIFYTQKIHEQVGKGIFLACVVTLGKRWGPETLWIFTLEKHATKNHLPKLILRAVEATSAALIECLSSRTQSRDFLSV